MTAKGSTASSGSGHKTNPIALGIAAASALVGLVMLYRSRGKDSDSEDEVDSADKNDQAGSQPTDTVASSNSAPSNPASYGPEVSTPLSGQELSGTGLPVSLVAKSVTVTGPAGRGGLLKSWSDKQIGLSIDFAVQTLQLVKEERRAPALLIKFHVLKDPTTTVSVVVEHCANESDHPELTSKEGLLSAREYQAICLHKLEDCAKILSEDDVTLAGAQVPAVHYCYEDGHYHPTVWFVRSLFFTHKAYAATIQISSKHQSKGVNQSLLPTLRWDLPEPSPSHLLVAEPRFGLAFSLPIHFQLCRSEEYMERDRHADDGTVTSCVWAEVQSDDKHQLVLAKYERYPQSQWTAKDLCPKVTARCVDMFGIKNPPAVHTDLGPAGKGHHISFRPLTVSTGESRGNGRDTPVKLSGYGGAVAVKIDDHTLTSLADLDDAASSISNRNEHSPLKRTNSRGRRDQASGMNATLVAYIFPIRNEFISIVFLNKDPHISAAHFTAFANGTIETLSFGNHHGQDTACIYRNLRHPQPFSITVTSHTRVVEPLIGDPLVVLQFDGLQNQVVYIRPFVMPQPTTLNSKVLLPQLERRLQSMLYMLPGKTIIESCHPIEIRGMFGFQIQHTHELLLDVSEDALDRHENDSMMIGTCSVEDDHTMQSTATSATTADVGGEEFTLDNPMSQYDHTRVINPNTVELAAEPQEGDMVSCRMSIVLFHHGVAYLFRICSSPYMFEQARATITDVVRNFSFIESEDE